MLTAESVSAYVEQLKLEVKRSQVKCHRLVRAGPLCVAQPRHIARSAGIGEGVIQNDASCDSFVLSTSVSARPSHVDSVAKVAMWSSVIWAAMPLKSPAFCFSRRRAIALEPGLVHDESVVGVLA